MTIAFTDDEIALVREHLSGPGFSVEVDSAKRTITVFNAWLQPPYIITKTEYVYSDHGHTDDYERWDHGRFHSYHMAYDIFPGQYKSSRSEYENLATSALGLLQVLAVGLAAAARLSLQWSAAAYTTIWRAIDNVRAAGAHDPDKLANELALRRRHLREAGCAAFRCTRPDHIVDKYKTTSGLESLGLDDKYWVEYEHDGTMLCRLTVESLRGMGKVEVTIATTYYRTCIDGTGTILASAKVTGDVDDEGSETLAREAFIAAVHDLQRTLCGMPSNHYPEGRPVVEPGPYATTSNRYSHEKHPHGMIGYHLKEVLYTLCASNLQELMR